MADAYLTTSDVAVFNKVDMDLMVSDVLNDAPLLRALAARTVRGNSFVYSKETVAPSVGFRAVNDGIENTKGTRQKVTVSLGVLDASFAVDIAAAQSDERGEDHLMGVEALAHLKQAMREVEEQLLNGTVGNQAADAFDGFADQTNLDELADDQVVDAGGTAANTGSSVYLIRAGELDVQVLWGQSGEINIGDRQIVERDGATGRFPAYYHPILGWCGVKIGSVHSVVRIANLTEDSGATLDDDLIYDALAVFPTSRQPTHIAMNRRSLKQLRKSRTATNATGTPAPRPTDVDGIPIVPTDSISSTEALLS